MAARPRHEAIESFAALHVISNQAPSQTSSLVFFDWGAPEVSWIAVFGPFMIHLCHCQPIDIAATHPFIVHGVIFILSWEELWRGKQKGARGRRPMFAI